MGFLDNTVINTNQVDSPWLLVLYGKGGVGKSELAARAEKPFFLATESGIDHIEGIGSIKEISETTGKEVVKIPKTIADFFEALKFCGSLSLDDYKTIVIDSAKFIDLLATAAIIEGKPYEIKDNREVEVKGLGDYNYPYGYDRLLRVWARVIAGTDFLKSKGFNVIIIGHSSSFNEENVITGDKFKKQGIDLVRYGQYNVGELLFVKSDATYFMRSEVVTKTVGAGKRAKQVAAQGTTPDVMVYTRSQSGFDAKVRAKHSTNIPDSYQIDWDDNGTSKIIFNDLNK